MTDIGELMGNDEMILSRGLQKQGDYWGFLHSLGRKQPIKP